MTATQIIWLVFGAATYTVIIAVFFLKLGVGLGRNFERVPQRQAEPEFPDFAPSDVVRPE